MQALASHLNTLDFCDRLNEVYHVSCFIGDFVGAVSADKWEVSQPAWLGMLTICMALSQSIADLTAEAKKLPKYSIPA